MIQDPSPINTEAVAQAPSRRRTASPQEIYRRIALRGPLSNATRTEAKILIFLSAFTLAVKAPGNSQIVSSLSGAASLRPQVIPLTFMAAVFYFSSLLLIHTICEVIIWWPNWRYARRHDNTLSAGMITTISAVRVLLECVLPLVLGFLAIR
jgi:hypothetical protein